jgi:hypothetical protein
VLLRLGAAGLTLAVSLSGALLARPASASGAVPPVRATVADPSAVPAADLAFVRMLSQRDPRDGVRTAAWTALQSSARAAAIRRFLRTGYKSASDLAATARGRNADYVKLVLLTYGEENAPEVNAAARYARDGSELDRHLFVNGGFEAARERDQLARAASGELARAVAGTDRAFVATLLDGHLGPQVQASARWALRRDDDNDLVEFFAVGWAHGASLDLQVHRTRVADTDAAWRAKLQQLKIDAEAAERAAAELSGEDAARKRADAALKWRTIQNDATPVRSVWAEAHAEAEKQKANWHAVLLAALAAVDAKNPNWAPVRASAVATETEWDAEHTAATEQLAFWENLLAQARAGEARTATAAPQT